MAANRPAREAVVVDASSVDQLADRRSEAVVERLLEAIRGEELAHRLAEEIADRLAVRLGGVMPSAGEPLVDAAEIARRHGKTRSWVYDHAGELGAVRLGSGPRPRLGFSPGRVAAALQRLDQPQPLKLPEHAQPRRRRSHTGRTPSGAKLLRVRAREVG